MGVRSQSDSFQATKPPKSALIARSIQVVYYTGVAFCFNVCDGPELSIIRDSPQNTLPVVYWFARHAKQSTPGKTSAKATLVLGDTVCELGQQPADEGRIQKH